MTKTNKIWIGIILTTCLLSVLALWQVQRISQSLSDPGQALVYVDQVLVHSVDLSQLDGPTTTLIETGHGKNLIEFTSDSVRVVEADCPDQICVHQGPIKTSAIPIVCLPHKVVVRLTPSTQERGEDPVDAIVR